MGKSLPGSAIVAGSLIFSACNEKPIELGANTKEEKEKSEEPTSKGSEKRVNGGGELHGAPAHTIQEKMDALTKELEETRARNVKLERLIALYDKTPEKPQPGSRQAIREEAKGSYIDLSATHGKEFKAVQIMGIDPSGMRIHRLSGPVYITWKELPRSVQLKFQFSEKEEAAHLQAMTKAGEIRREDFAKWKVKQTLHDPAERVRQLDVKIESTLAEIEMSESDVQSRLTELKAWKSKASRQEAFASEAKGEATRRKALQSADLARERARQLAELNSNSWIEITVGKSLLKEMRDLKTELELKYPGKK